MGKKDCVSKKKCAKRELFDCNSDIFGRACRSYVSREFAALTAERDKLKAENEELKSYQRDLCTDIDRLQRNETGMIKEIAERIIKQRQTEAELTAAVAHWADKGYCDCCIAKRTCDKEYIRRHNDCNMDPEICEQQIRGVLKAVVEKGKEDSEK